MKNMSNWMQIIIKQIIRTSKIFVNLVFYFLSTFIWDIVRKIFFFGLQEINKRRISGNAKNKV